MTMHSIPQNIDEVGELLLDVHRRLDLIEGVRGGGLSHSRLKDIEEHEKYLKADGSVPMINSLDMGLSKIVNSGNRVLDIDIYQGDIRLDNTLNALYVDNMDFGNIGGLTSGSVPFADSNGYLTEDSDFTYNPTTNVLSLGAIQFDTSNTTTMVEGLMRWNDDDKTLNVGMPGGEVVMQIGQEMYIPGRVKNETGGTLVNGTVVFINGVSGGKSTVAKADASTEALSYKTIGLVTEDITNNNLGHVTTFGLVRGSVGQPVDTRGFATGDILYLSETAGEFTNVKPTSPAHAVTLGCVRVVSATVGEIMVHVTNGFELFELHDVDDGLVTPTDKGILYWDDTAKLWKQTAKVLWDETGSKLTINNALDLSDGNITNVGDISLDRILSDAGTSITVFLGTDAGDDLIVGNNNALVVSGDTDYAGFGTNEPEANVHIKRTINGTELYIESTAKQAFLDFENKTTGQNGQALLRVLVDDFTLQGAGAVLYEGAFVEPGISQAWAVGTFYWLNPDKFNIGYYNGSAWTSPLTVLTTGQIGFNQVTPTAMHHIVPNSITEEGIFIQGPENYTGDYINIQDSNANELFSLSATDIVFNAALLDRDFIIGGDTEANLFRVDAGTDEVRMGDWDTNYMAVESDGDVNFVGGAGLQYGCINYHGAGSDTVLAAQDTFYQITAFDNNSASNGDVTPDHTNDHITVGKAGDYQIFIGLSARSAAANDYEVSVFKNNGATRLTPISIHMTTAVAGRVQTASMMCFAESLSANDTIEAWVQRTDGGAVAKTFTVDHIVLNVKQIGG